jgi:hypothetical protein
MAVKNYWTHTGQTVTEVKITDEVISDVEQHDTPVCHQPVTAGRPPNPLADVASTPRRPAQKAAPIETAPRAPAAQVARPATPAAKEGVGVGM